ncbi:hypothetical protein LJR129_002485 [Acidovorax sp. LjRoot129]|uniref:hypothetical protein n=1 Tax=Acidovorax sp. LjRoot129 TaxID=3342260 RepID=UPI003ECEA925
MNEAELIATQDRLRPLRMFVGAFSGALAGYDQAVQGQDGYSWSIPGQFQSIGPNGVAIEGRPVTISRNGGVFISPMVVLIGLGAAAVLLLRKG